MGEDEDDTERSDVVPTSLVDALAALEAERLARRREQALIRSARALSATLHLDDVLPVILEELRVVVPYDTASVQELQGDQMVIVGGSGIDLGVFHRIGFDARSGRTPNSDVLDGRRPVIVADIRDDHSYADFPHPAHAMSGVLCWLGVPMIFGDECIGMLTLDSFEADFYTEEHARTALEFASQAAVALTNARAFATSQWEVEERRRAEEELRQVNADLQRRMSEIEALQEHLREQAVRDPLTGLFNRRYLMETLEREVARCRRAGQPLAVAMIDVDHFKAVNDGLGHDAGDRVLVAVGGYLHSQVREGDAACRYGGEEFVVVLPDTTLEVAERRAEEWRTAVHQVPASGLDRPITVSIGLAALPDHGSSANALIRFADDAMYAAKGLGRDRVVVADVPCEGKAED